MKAIRHTLTERFYLWEDARKLAESDPEIDLGNTVEAYKPRSYLEEEEAAVDGENQGTGEGQQLHEGQAPETEADPKTGAEKIDPSTLPAKPAETPTTRP